jgi:hypothetical protein
MRVRELFLEYIFHQIKHAFLDAFASEEAKQRGDKWHPIGLLLNRFNVMRDAGSLAPGDPYVAQFPNKSEKMKTRKVPLHCAKK